MNQLYLFPPPPAAAPLSAYLASALTGLDDNQRELVFHVSDTVATLCEEQGIALYEPRKKTDPVYHPDVADTEVFRVDRERVLGSDLLIYLCHFPSTGAGQELDFAFNGLVPILLVAHRDCRVSRMVRGIPCFKREVLYDEPEDLRAELRAVLADLRPTLQARRSARELDGTNVVGERVRALREARGWTREALAGRVVPPLAIEALQLIEDAPDHLSNPSLTQLRQVAAALETSVADLVEPEVDRHVRSTLEEWVAERTAARLGGAQQRDRNRLVRRVLLRVLDSLEEE